MISQFLFRGAVSLLVGVFPSFLDFFSLNFFAPGVSPPLPAILALLFELRSKFMS